MIILRRRLFSKNDKPEKKEERSLKAPIAGLIGSNLLLAKSVNKDVPDHLKKEDKKIKELLKSKYKDETKIYELTSEQEKALLEAQYKKKGKKVPKNARIGNHYNPSLNRVILTPTGHNSATLAHELGHRDHWYPKESRKVPVSGRITHGMSSIIRGKNPLSRTITGGQLVATIGSGIDAAHKEEKGEKQQGIDRWGGTSISVAKQLPTLHKEYAASKRGLEMLKEVGASKNLQRYARNRLIKAGGTYATVAGVNVLSNEALRKGVKTLEKKRIEHNKKKKSE